VNELDMDSGLASVVEYVREVHTPIWQAIADGRPVTSTDCAVLSGAMKALLDAIDTRRPQPPVLVALAAVAA
jgi:hypothetical protein